MTAITIALKTRVPRGGTQEILTDFFSVCKKKKRMDRQLVRLNYLLL